MIVYDQLLLYEAIEQLLACSTDIRIVARSHVREDPLTTIRNCSEQIDIILLDVHPGGSTHYVHYSVIQQQFPVIRLLLLSMHKVGRHVYLAWQSGVSGYLFKDEIGRELGAALYHICAGHRYFQGTVQGALNTFLRD